MQLKVLGGDSQLTLHWSGQMLALGAEAKVSAAAQFRRQLVV